VSFVQRFGSALNAHTHLHCCVTDGVFSLDTGGTLRFHPAADFDAAATGTVQRRIRSRVLRAAVRHGALTPEVAADLARWGHGGGFSLHAAVRIEAEDRAGLERPLRYCARPAFASERLSWARHDQPVRYTLPKPLPSGQIELTLAPLELLDRLAALIPPPRRHRHHYAGVFAPHAALRARVTACAGQPVTEIALPPGLRGAPHSRSAFRHRRYLDLVMSDSRIAFADQRRQCEPVEVARFRELESRTGGVARASQRVRPGNEGSSRRRRKTKKERPRSQALRFRRQPARRL
jgi:hypothetical protein